jgi:hypothetical protein
METTRKFREALEALKGRRKPTLKAVSELRRVLLNTDTPQKADGSNSSWIQELLAQYDRDSLQELVDLIQSVSVLVCAKNTGQNLCGWYAAGIGRR